MGKKYDIVALGEILIDFTEIGSSEYGQSVFQQNPGGAPVNMLTAASHMGAKTAFIGKVGSDMHGNFLRRVLVRENIDTKGLVFSDEFFTTLAFVKIGDDGNREFSFARKPGADAEIKEDEINYELLSECRVFHFGSLSMTNEPARGTTIKAMETAKKSGAIISFDPNYRESLWKEEAEAVKTIKSVLNSVDILKVSDEEAELLTGEEDVSRAADAFLAYGIKIVAITMGKDGVLVAGKGKKSMVESFSVKAVDTTGAGDSFYGGFISSLIYGIDDINEVDWNRLKYCAFIGNAVAALCVQKLGGIPSIPEKSEVEKMVCQEGRSIKTYSESIS